MARTAGKKGVTVFMFPILKWPHETPNVRAEKTMTATDVTGFDAIFSTGFFATFSIF